MSTFAFLLMCVQACLIQIALSQCAGRVSPGYGSVFSYGGNSFGLSSGINSGCGARLGTTNLGVGLAAYGNSVSTAGAYGNPAGSYGGIGVGNAIVLGELPVNGITGVSGQIPVAGLVQFNGPVPASGRVSISGSCGCGCDGY